MIDVLSEMRKGAARSSRRESVVVRGELTGMGHEAQCLMIAIRQLNEHEYVKCEMFHAPPHLPNGLYAVVLGEQQIGIEKSNGEWQAGIA
jgi:hypothetical protein